MKIGIIVHSHTGNTLSVAQRLEEELVKAGHTVKLERVRADNEDPSAAGMAKLIEAPEVNEYDALIFGAPVRGFSVSRIMKLYLAQLPSLTGKKVGCFVTQQFPYPWLGGNKSVRQMKKLCRTKGVNEFVTGIVNWSHKNRDTKIIEVLGNLKAACR